MFSSEELDDLDMKIKSAWRSDESVDTIMATSISCSRLVLSSFFSTFDKSRGLCCILLVVFKSSSAKSLRATCGELDDMVLYSCSSLAVGGELEENDRRNRLLTRFCVMVEDASVSELLVECSTEMTAPEKSVLVPVLFDRRIRTADLGDVKNRLFPAEIPSSSSLLGVTTRPSRDFLADLPGVRKSFLKKPFPGVRLIRAVGTLEVDAANLTGLLAGVVASLFLNRLPNAPLDVSYCCCCCSSTCTRSVFPSVSLPLE